MKKLIKDEHLVDNFTNPAALPYSSIQLHTDGALARHYKRQDLVALAQKIGFAVYDVAMAGPKSDIVLFPVGGLKFFLYHILPDALNRFLVRACRMGSFLIVSLKK